MKRYESFMYLTKLNLHQDSFSKRNKSKLTIITNNISKDIRKNMIAW